MTWPSSASRKLPVGHLDVLDDAEDVGELQAQELDALALGTFENGGFLIHEVRNAAVQYTARPAPQRRGRLARTHARARQPIPVTCRLTRETPGDRRAREGRGREFSGEDEMKRQRMAMYAGLLAATVAVGVTGVTARSNDGTRPDARDNRSEGAAQDRGNRTNREEQPAGPFDRRLLRLDGRGSQLGVMVSDVDDATRTGVRIDGVTEGSAAAKAGAKEGDVVVEFDGERVRSARQLTRLVQETPSGHAVKMTVLRSGTRQTLDVTLEATESDFAARLEPGIRTEVERSLRGLRDLPAMEPPAFDFRWNERGGGRFDGGIPFLTGRGRLGVQVDGLSDQLASYFGVTSGGVLVSSVTRESAADKAGLKAGDVITTVNGSAVRDADDLLRALADVKDGAEIALGIVRDKKASTVKATLETPRPRSPRTARPA